MRRLALGLVCVIATGCNAVFGLDARPLAPEDGDVEETSIDLDSSVADTSIDTGEQMADTTVDTSVVDSDSMDTTVADSTTPPGDTAMPPADTSIDVGTGPILTGSIETLSATGTTNLTTEGVLDWAHWGHTMYSSFNHRVGANLIGKGTFTTPAYAYSMYTRQFTWSDGTPTASATVDEGIAVINNGDYFTVDAEASTTNVRALRIYAVYGKATGALTATLSDSSAPALSTMGPAASMTTIYVALVYNFRASTAGARLTVKMVKQGPTGSLNTLSLLAATLR